jgi:hypothetical protein
MDINSQSKIIWQSDNITLIALTGKEAKEYLPQIANIRINMFKEFPYLYKGSLEDEKIYLDTYFNSKDTIILLAFDKQRLIAFSNSIPLEQEMDEIKQPFIKNNIDIKKYLYIGEMMIYPEHRNKNLFNIMYKFHEDNAKSIYSNIVFMSVTRSRNHPSKPRNYRPLDILWKHNGYQELNKIKINLSWKQIDTNKLEENKLSVWSKKLKE